MPQPKKKLIPRVGSLGELYRLGLDDDRYAKLAIAGAQNLGGGDRCVTLAGAIAWLRLNAQETDERGVVAEVNACRDLI